MYRVFERARCWYYLLQLARQQIPLAIPLFHLLAPEFAGLRAGGVASHSLFKWYVQVVEPGDAAVVMTQRCESRPAVGSIQDAVDDHMEAMPERVASDRINQADTGPPAISRSRRIIRRNMSWLT